MNSLVSIIMPTYNSDEYLIQTIESVLRQTYRNWELIIVDDYSQDNTIEILNYFKNNPKIKIYLNRNNKGSDSCRNIGLEKCKGKYIAFLDSDDIWSKYKLEEQIKFMKTYKLNFTCTNYIPFDKNHKISIVKPQKVYNTKLFFKDTSIATSTMIILKSKFKKLKFKKNFGFGDYIYKVKLLEIDKCYTLNQPLTYYRVRNSSVSSNKFKNFIYVWRINQIIFNFNFLKNIYYIFFITQKSLKKYNLILNKSKLMKFTKEEKKNLFNIGKKYQSFLSKFINSGPKVSVIIPSYNAAQTLKRAIDSVFKQIYKNWEIILIDDCSKDNTKKIVNKFNSKKIKYFKNTHRKGQAFSRNIGLKKSTGFYLAFLDADDEWDVYKLKNQINFMQKNNLDFSFTNYEYIIDNKSICMNLPEKVSFQKLLKENIIGQSTVIYQKEKFKNYLFSEIYRMDYNFWLNIFSKKRKFLYCLNKYYTKIYSTNSSESKSRIRNLILNWKTLRQSINLSFFVTLYFLFFQILNSILKKNKLKFF